VLLKPLLKVLVSFGCHIVHVAFTVRFACWFHVTELLSMNASLALDVTLLNKTVHMHF
jgi:hypothetical protein